ncbi:MAG TPA: TetR/AcrR family transcriptional regulator [Acidimicrobiales bacterium]|nr:TetR/AcrR family transcriptional regulator [Acidimicrobiales bacterium]
MPAHRRGSKETGRFPVSPTLRQPATDRGPRAARTVANILQATKAILLARGYAGTTVDEIAKVAGISRASFYTYFPSKRDALLALGAESEHAGATMVDFAAELHHPLDEGQLLDFVRRCFAVLDDEASFAFAWTQAAQLDEEIRIAGMKGHLRICARLGRTLSKLGGRVYSDPAAAGLAILSQLERAWFYCQLYDRPILKEAVQADIAGQLMASLTATFDAPASAKRRRVG